MHPLLPLPAVLAAGLAHATVGGATEVRVLGHDPVDDKLFLLREDATGEVGRLLYYALGAPPAEQAADRPVAVKSWYEGSFDEVERAFPGRMAALEKRLQPVPPTDRAGLVLEVREGPLELCPKGAGDGTRAEQAAALAAAAKDGRAGVRWQDDGGLMIFVCRRSEVRVQWAGHGATTTLSGWGGVQVGGTWRLPDGRPLVMLRHRGITFESGYAEDVPLLLAPKVQ